MLGTKGNLSSSFLFFDRFYFLKALVKMKRIKMRICQSRLALVFVLLKLIWPQRIYNSHYGNGAPSIFTSQYYLKLRGKHCRKPHCRNGVVDTLGLVLTCKGLQCCTIALHIVFCQFDINMSKSISMKLALRGHFSLYFDRCECF